MSRFDTSKRGRGTVFPPVSYRETENREEKGFNPREVGNAVSPVPRPLSLFEQAERQAAAALMPSTVWPSRRAYVRYMATSRPAVSMTKELRREAARDPGLEWVPEAHRYRLLRRSDGEGGEKVSEPSRKGPAAATGINANTNFPAGILPAHAHARDGT
jgi:hypothetical protein